MADADDVRNREIERVSLLVDSSPRDLLQRFRTENQLPVKFEPETEGDRTEEIELSLGLSLNGRFGVDPQAKMLTRSSSISDFYMTKVGNGDGARVMPIACTAVLSRACSLPTETEEEWRKRKELQSLRRMEAKRKRTEKQRNFRAAKDRTVLEEICVEDKRAESVNGNHQQQQSPKVPKEICPSTAHASGVLGWVSTGGGSFVACGDHGVEKKAEKANGSLGGGGGGGIERMPPLPRPPSSQGSQGSGSSGVSDFESQTFQGMNKNTEARSPASVQSLPDPIEQYPIVTARTTADKPCKFDGVVMEKPSMKLRVADKGSKDMAKNAMEDMPCVSTKGDGPNGKRIEGFLYRYGKGEEVRIVCVCHGSFLSPAEFVKHAGGGDVAHPLRHIVVNPSFLL